MKKNGLVSVIIPAYNAQNTIEECVKSVCNQTYANIEIIIVNDGSTDNTQAICEHLREGDSRIILVNQKNAGSAAARGRGVMEARGEYHTYVDADDVVKPLLVETLAGYADGADIVVDGCYRQERDGHMTERRNGICEGSYKEDDMLFIRENMIFVDSVDNDGILPYMISKLYRTSLVKNLMQQISNQIRIYEDRFFVWCYLMLAESVTVINEQLYIYRYNENSIMHSVDTNYMQNLNNLYMFSLDFFKKHDASSVVYDKLEKFVTNKMYVAPEFLGFSWKNRCLQFYPPYDSLNSYNNIIIYGAGRVGIDYYRVLRKRVVDGNLHWTDKRWEMLSEDGMPVESPDKVFAESYDIVILAAKSEWMANEMRKELVERGIATQKILWEQPIVLKDL